MRERVRVTISKGRWVAAGEAQTAKWRPGLVGGYANPTDYFKNRLREATTMHVAVTVEGASPHAIWQGQGVAVRDPDDARDRYLAERIALDRAIKDAVMPGDIKDIVNRVYMDPAFKFDEALSFQRLTKRMKRPEEESGPLAQEPQEPQVIHDDFGTVEISGGQPEFLEALRQAARAEGFLELLPGVFVKMQSHG